MVPRRLLPALSAALAIGAAAGCGAAVRDVAGGASGTGGGAAGGRLSVLASFYPLEWIAGRVGGERVEVANLTKAGAEPHDLELAPQDVAALADADVVVYLEGFQPAVDEAVAQQAAGRGYEAGAVAGLTLRYTPIEEGELAAAEQGVDPHFWLDPTKLSAVATGLAERLGAADPGGAQGYQRNAQALRSELAALDAELRAGLRSCASTDLVTSHNAFGYFAARYGLRQVGITGLTPEDEPAPQDLAEAARFVRENSVRTIYYETLVSPAIARTIASETGARTAVLDPIEGLSEASAGRDYPSVMRANLAALREGQGCP